MKVKERHRVFRISVQNEWPVFIEYDPTFKDEKNERGVKGLGGIHIAGCDVKCSREEVAEAIVFLRHYLDGTLHEKLKELCDKEEP
jgi:hypothetical protein